MARFLYDWQTLAAGLFALLAAVGTIRETRSTARKQIDASGEDARKVIAATRDLTEATFKQTETTVRLEEKRVADEDRAFRAVLGAAMTGVLAEAAWTRENYSQVFARTDERSIDGYAVRQCITKGAFAELRAACLKLGSPLTSEFLDLERQIDNFASQWRDVPWAGNMRREGKHVGLTEQLTTIEDKAFALRELAARPGFGLKMPGRAKHASPLG